MRLKPARCKVTGCPAQAVRNKLCTGHNDAVAASRSLGAQLATANAKQAQPESAPNLNPLTALSCTYIEPQTGERCTGGQIPGSAQLR
jgi:hypothetical protein